MLQVMNYSSKLETFATAHWSSRKHCPEREADVEAAAEEPLLSSEDDDGKWATPPPPFLPPFSQTYEM